MKFYFLFTLVTIFSNFTFSQTLELSKDIKEEKREYVQMIDNSSVTFNEKNPFSKSDLEKENFKKIIISYSELESIPLDIFKLKYISELYISMPKLKKIPNEICELKGLKRLSIKGTFSELPNDIDKLSNLVILSLQSLNKDFATIPDQIFNLPQLVKLNLWIPYVKNFPNKITNLKNLSTLEINIVNLKYFPDGIENCLELKALKISTNELDSFPKSFSKLKKLKKIEYNANRLDSLGKMPSFNFSNESLSIIIINSYERFPIQFSNLNNFPSLKILQLSSVNVKEFRNLSSCPNLNEIRIFNGDLTNIPEEVFLLKNLQKLYLRRNKIEQIPLDYFQKNKYLNLYLDSNPILRKNPELFKSYTNVFR